MAFDQCRFAECLSKYEAIWNVKAKDHGNKERRKAQLQALADECGISVDLAETKYTSLRTYFVKQRRKVKESQRNGCSPGDIYRPSWPPYSSLTFLEKTLDLQNPSDTMPDSSMRPSMVDNVRPSMADNLGLVTMLEPAKPVLPEAGVQLPVPEVNTIILSMPENSRSPTPNSVASPLLESSMRIPMPESMRLPIKTEDKEPVECPERCQELIEVRHIDDSPPASAVSSLNNTLAPRTSSIPISPPSYRSSFSTPLNSFTPLPSVSTLCPASSSSTPVTQPSLSRAFPYPLCSSLAIPYPPPTKIRKRCAPRAEDTELGVLLQNAVDGLRAMTENCREDRNDDVSGFLKMTGFQLRSIHDPIRRMRIMHAIQGLILSELSSSFSTNSESSVPKHSEDRENTTFSI